MAEESTATKATGAVRNAFNTVTKIAKPALALTAVFSLMALTGGGIEILTQSSALEAGSTIGFTDIAKVPLEGLSETLGFIGDGADWAKTSLG